MIMLKIIEVSPPMIHESTDTTHLRSMLHSVILLSCKSIELITLMLFMFTVLHHYVFSPYMHFHT